jgi:KaiC/GvpD/RAD55 family RecA-like ATPase
MSLQLSQDLFRYLLPEGLPRGSFIILAGEGGSGKSVILIHLVKDVLNAGEPVVYLTLDDDPLTVLKQLSVFKISIENYCSQRLLSIIDGFSYTMRQRRGRVHPCIIDEISPENPDNTITTLIKIVEQFKLEGRGLVVIDSLNEAMISLDPARFVFFIKSLRANIAKYRDIITIATLHTSTNELRNYLLIIEHLVDGVLETSSIPEDLASQIPVFVRQIRVLKMKGASHRQGWVFYSIDSEGVKPAILRIKS